MNIDLKVIPITAIKVGERFRQEYGDIDTLAASLKKEGIIQPLAVRACEDGTFDLLAGGRRLKAAGQAGIQEIPVRIYDKELNEYEMRSIELMENVCRKDMSWAEASRLKEEIFKLQVKIYGEKTSTAKDAPGVSLRDTAKLLGISAGTLSEDVALAEALKTFPQLEKAKSKSDATKLLRKMQEEVITAELAKRVASRQANTPTDLLHKNLIDNYIVMDFFDGVSKVPDRSVDLVEIDPPYGIQLGVSGIKKTDDSTKADTRNYNEVPVEQYQTFLTNLFKECHRVMSENSWLICWFAQDPWFETVYQSIMRAGFKGPRIPAIWVKENFSGQANHPEVLLANTYETFFYVRKGSPVISRMGRSNVFRFKPVFSQNKIHPTERPIEMIQDVLQTFAWEGCRVMVPFLGSGNTLLAASNIGLTAFGYELSQEYKSAYSLRVVSGRPQAYKSYRQEEAKNDKESISGPGDDWC